MRKTWLLPCFLLLLLVAACGESVTSNTQIRVELVDGNVRRTYVYQQAVSVDEFLRRLDITLGELDRVNPSPFTQIQDGMTITIVRVAEEISCREQDLPFETRRIPTDALEPNSEEIAQSGVNGVLQVCERCVFENGARLSCSTTSQTVIREAQEQIIYYGTGGADVPIVVEGKLAYIANGQAWFIEGNARARRPLTTEGRLDGRVFDLSANGRQLLYSRQTDASDDPDFANELWAILDTGAPQPLRLLPDNVISGGWYPAETFTLTYSTAEPRQEFPGWEAYNDIYLMKIDPATGETVDFRDVVGVNAIGIYAYWGTTYAWSPDGSQLAWSRADSVGLVDLENGDFVTLATFPHFDPAIVAKWVWQPDLHWSQDSQMLITTLHGPPYGTESPINSVVFNVAVLSPRRNLLVASARPLTGLWARPRYSPIQEDAAGFPDYRIAYLQARDPLNSLGGEYDLAVADRDASNPKIIFPPPDRVGIRPFNERQPTEFVWSPSGTHIAILYQGNLWLVEVDTGLAQQVTTDGQVSRPVWRN